MRQSNLKTEFFEHAGGYGWVFIVDPLSGLMIKAATAKTKKTAYKRAAAKLRNLADEAEQIGRELLEHSGDNQLGWVHTDDIHEVCKLEEE